jgi:hypothetical protein
VADGVVGAVLVQREEAHVGVSSASNNGQLVALLPALCSRLPEPERDHPSCGERGSSLSVALEIDFEAADLEGG